MNELSLFSGAGGGLLASLLLGWRPVGYVEWDDYCQRVIAQRIADGILPAAPIFTDVREFSKSGAAAEYRGVADVVSGGFSCQPFSVAGKRAGADDSRNMWPAMLECIRLVRPRYAFMENVPGLLTSGYFGRILGDLAESGYDARWRILSAAELGAPHRRDRLWIVAVSNADNSTRSAEQEREHNRSKKSAGSCENGVEAWDDVAHPNSRRRPQREAGERAVPEPDACGPHASMAHAPHPNGRTHGLSLLGETERGESGGGGGRSATGVGWWSIEPNVGRVADGIPDRVAQLRAAGNAQVPAVAAAAWKLLTGDLP